MSDVSELDGGSRSILSVVERSAQFKRGPPPLPRKLIWIAIAILAVLGVGGAFADSSFNVLPSSPPKTNVHDAKKVPRTLAQFVDVHVLARRPAPPVELVDESGRTFALGALRGKAVAISFLDPRCRDICPVESVEFRDAAGDLGAARSKVAFVIIDANPRDLGVAAARSGFSRAGLSSLPDAYFLAGTLSQLDGIWKAYGVTVEYAPVDRSARPHECDRCRRSSWPPRICTRALRERVAVGDFHLGGGADAALRVRDCPLSRGSVAVTEKLEMDAFAASLYGDRVAPTRRDRWLRFRRVGLPLLAVVLIIVAVAVATDLPHNESLAGERSSASYLITLVNGYIEPCA